MSTCDGVSQVTWIVSISKEAFYLKDGASGETKTDFVQKKLLCNHLMILTIHFRIQTARFGPPGLNKRI